MKDTLTSYQYFLATYPKSFSKLNSQPFFMLFLLFFEALANVYLGATSRPVNMYLYVLPSKDIMRYIKQIKQMPLIIFDVLWWRCIGARFANHGLTFYFNIDVSLCSSLIVLIASQSDQVKSRVDRRPPLVFWLSFIQGNCKEHMWSDLYQL